MKELQHTNQLHAQIAELLRAARQSIARNVNQTMTVTYFEIGRMIVEDEQQGSQRAEYGKAVLKNLSQKLIVEFGKGFSVDNLQYMRQFYLTFQIYETPSRKLMAPISQTTSAELPVSISETASRKFIVSWSHYLILMRIENPDERSFYEIEAAANNWSVKELKRQYHSSLYERLALSRNKGEVLRLALEGQKIEKPEDILKSPLTLEFLGMEGKSEYSETDLEHAILSKIQHFLLELGKGFLFEARQKRFTFSEKHYFVDLFFYNRLLQCYVLIDPKTETQNPKPASKTSNQIPMK